MMKQGGVYALMCMLVCTHSTVGVGFVYVYVVYVLVGIRTHSQGYYLLTPPD